MPNIDNRNQLIINPTNDETSIIKLISASAASELKIIIDQNSIKSDILKVLRVIKYNPLIKTLNLGDSDLQQQENKIKHTTTVVLECNGDKCTSIKILARKLTPIFKEIPKQITELKLNNNRLNLVGERIFSSLPKTIKKIDLTGNKIEEKGITSFSTLIDNLNNLDELKIDSLSAAKKNIALSKADKLILITGAEQEEVSRKEYIDLHRENLIEKLTNYKNTRTNKSDYLHTFFGIGLGYSKGQKLNSVDLFINVLEKKRP